MENSPMNYFLEVCESGSIGKAAKKLGVTPQAVSKAVAALEKELGYALLIRSAEGCAPTENGAEVRKIGLRMRRFHDNAMMQIRGLSHEPAAARQVHIAVWGTFATIMPPSDYADFQMLYPEIRLCLHSYPNLGACEAAMRRGEVELAFCPSGPSAENIVCLQEYGCSPYLIVGGQNRLASMRQAKLSELKDQNLIADYDESGERMMLADELEEAGLVPALVLPMLSDALKRRLVLEENYVAFSYCPVGWLPYGIVPLELPEIRRYSGSVFACLADRPLSDAAKKYVDYIVPRFKKDIFGGREA